MVEVKHFLGFFQLIFDFLDEILNDLDENLETL